MANPELRGEPTSGLGRRDMLLCGVHGADRREDA